MSCEKRSRHWWFFGAFGILLSVLLMGYISDGKVQSGEPARASFNDTTKPRVIAKIADQTINLEVAQTPGEQAKGLMYRTTLADNQGMLFPFDPPQPVGFWMKNVPISLDIVFLRAGKVVKIAANLPSCTQSSCPVYSSEVSVDQVIELRGGRAAELGLKPGDPISIQLLPAVKTSLLS